MGTQHAIEVFVLLSSRWDPKDRMYDTRSWWVYIEIGSTRKVTATCGRRVFKFKFASELWICFLYRLAGHASTLLLTEDYIACSYMVSLRKQILRNVALD